MEPARWQKFGSPQALTAAEIIGHHLHSLTLGQGHYHVISAVHGRKRHCLFNPVRGVGEVVEGDHVAAGIRDTENVELDGIADVRGTRKSCGTGEYRLTFGKVGVVAGDTVGRP